MDNTVDFDLNQIAQASSSYHKGGGLLGTLGGAFLAAGAAFATGGGSVLASVAAAGTSIASDVAPDSLKPVVGLASMYFGKKIAAHDAFNKVSGGLAEQAGQMTGGWNPISAASRVTHDFLGGPVEGE